MPDEKTDPTEAAIVRRVLAADGVEAERALGVLMRTMVEDFVKARGGAESGRNVMGKPNALDSLLNALMTQIQHNKQMHQQQPDEPMVRGSIAEVQGSLCEIAMECLRLAESQLEAHSQTPRMWIVE